MCHHYYRAAEVGVKAPMQCYMDSPVGVIETFFVSLH